MCLGLTYLLAAVAGAAGAGGCVHANLDGGGHAHVLHTPAADGGPEAHAHGLPIPLPCAAKAEVDATDDASSSDHDPAQPCDCLGDCCIGAEALGLPSTTVPQAGSLGATRGAPSHLDEVRVRAAQYRLPFPNAPPTLPTSS